MRIIRVYEAEEMPLGTVVFVTKLSVIFAPIIEHGFIYVA